MELNILLLSVIKHDTQLERIIIVSNQNGIESGLVSLESFEAKFQYVMKCVSDYTGIPVSGSYCTSGDASCGFRKPNTDMLESLFCECAGYSKKDCLMIGSKAPFSDDNEKTAKNFGIDYMDADEFIENVFDANAYVPEMFCGTPDACCGETCAKQ
jgi:histidinol phosphatase-like enzyme